MFVLIGKKRCPSCGVVGKLWKRRPEVLICPTCNSYFNEFGIVLETQMEQEESMLT